MRIFFLQIGSGILGLWLASQFVAGVEFVGPWKILLFAGFVLGLINLFIKPILNFITLPLRMLTFGLFGLVINMGMIWIVDILFVEFIIKGLIPLFWTTLIVWGLSFLLSLFFPKAKYG